MKQISIKSILAVIAGSVLVAACSGSLKIIQGTPNNLYTTAQNFYLKKDYTQSIKYFNSITTQYPVSNYAANSLVYMAYINYINSNYLKSLNQTSQYIKLFGVSGKNLDFILYTAGLDNTALNYHWLQYHLGMNPASHGTYLIKNAKEDFTYLNANFPNNPYKEDAQNRLNYANYLLSLHDAYEIKYYFYKKAYVATINLVKEMKKTYPTSNETYSMYPYLIASYTAIHLPEKAQEAKNQWNKHSNIKKFIYKNKPTYFVDLKLPKMSQPTEKYNYYGNLVSNVPSNLDPYVPTKPGSK
ncbi:MAG: outer membrane protein assembly factor BamD [Psittacicella sp.]